MEAVWCWGIPDRTPGRSGHARTGHLPRTHGLRRFVRLAEAVDAVVVLALRHQREADTTTVRCDSRLGLLAPLHRAGVPEQRLKMHAAIGPQGFLRQSGESSAKKSRSHLRPRRQDHDSVHWRIMADGQPRFFWGPLFGQNRRWHFDPSMSAILARPDVDPNCQAEWLLSRACFDKTRPDVEVDRIKRRTLNVRVQAREAFCASPATRC